LNPITSNTILYCRNWDATVAFYRDVLGIRGNELAEWLVEFRLTPGAAISIADERRTSIQSGGGAGLTVSIGVEEVEAAREEIIARGGTPEPLRSIWGSRAFFIRDPEGNRLEFWGR
jgi:catechol 2,3-dioxygenase-like lactoylglutathione lyase family enzyme